MHELQRLGWEWRQNGAIVSVRIDGQDLKVFVPLARVFLHFDQELSAVGCPFEGVGEPMTVGGLFSWVKKAVNVVKKAHTFVPGLIGKAAKKVLPKAIYRAAAAVHDTAKRYGQHALNIAKKVGTNKYFRAGLAAAAVAVPVLAPAAAAVEIANRAYGMYQRGVDAAKAIQRGIHTAENLASVRNGLAAKGAVAHMINAARNGDPRAQQIMGALQQRRA